MDAIEFYKEMKRMCDETDCKYCPLDQKCRPTANVEPEEVVEIVEEWSKEHPLHTRKSQFLEMFPNAQFSNIEHSFCTAHFDLTKVCEISEPSDEQCRACREQFWNERV